MEENMLYGGLRLAVGLTVLFVSGIQSQQTKEGVLELFPQFQELFQELDKKLTDLESVLQKMCK